MSGEIKPTADARNSVYGSIDSGKAGRSADASEPSVKAGNASGADTVNLTDKAQRLLELEDQLAKIPPVDSTRVAELRESIASGNYRADPERIADGMLELLKVGTRPGQES